MTPTIHPRFARRNLLLDTASAAWAVVLLCGVPGGLCGGESAATRPAADFVVAVTGDDRNPGTEAQPFATVGRARDAVRELRKSQPARDVLVLIRGGTYRMAEPLVFTPEDSGRDGGSVTYTAYPGEQPVLSGGRQITGFQLGDNGLWTAKVPDVRGGPWHFEQLYVSGRRAVRARTPNRFYFYMNAPRRPGVDPATGRPGKPDDRKFVANPQDLAPLVDLPPDRLRDVVVASYHSWHISRQYVASIMPQENVVVLTGTCSVPFFTYTQNERYFLGTIARRLTRPASGFSIATVRCTTSRCREKICRRPRSSRRSRIRCCSFSEPARTSRWQGSRCGG